MSHIENNLTDDCTNKEIEDFFDCFHEKNMSDFFAITNMSSVQKFIKNQPEKIDHILSKKNEHNKSFIDYFIQNITQLTKEENSPVFINPFLWGAINRNITNDHDYILPDNNYIFNYNEKYYLSKMPNLKFDIEIDYDNLGSYHLQKTADIFETHHLFKNQAGNHYMAIFAIQSLFYQFREHRDFEKSDTQYSLFLNKLSESNQFFNPDIFHDTIFNIKNVLINNNQNYLDFLQLGKYEHSKESRKETLNSIFKISDIYLEKKQLDNIVNSCSLNKSFNHTKRI